jgi:hypothetical protein
MKVAALALVAVAGVVAAKQMPEIQRYLKVRQM